MPDCPEDKILNPKTNRCVSATYAKKIGLVATTAPRQHRRQPPLSPVQQQQPCPEGKVVNPRTKKCVTEAYAKRIGIIGATTQQLQHQQQRPRRVDAEAEVAAVAAQTANDSSLYIPQEILDAIYERADVSTKTSLRSTTKLLRNKKARELRTDISYDFDSLYQLHKYLMTIFAIPQKYWSMDNELVTGHPQGFGVLTTKTAKRTTVTEYIHEPRIPKYHDDIIRIRRIGMTLHRTNSGTVLARVHIGTINTTQRMIKISTSEASSWKDLFSSNDYIYLLTLYLNLLQYHKDIRPIRGFALKKEMLTNILNQAVDEQRVAQNLRVFKEMYGIVNVDD